MGGNKPRKVIEGASISAEAYAELLKDWTEPVGRFVLAFSGCEYWTYAYLQGLGSRALRDSMANSRLNRRIDRIKSLVKRRGVPDPLRAEVFAALRKLSQLAKLRNLVAHNMPMAHIYVHKETDEVLVQWEYRGLHNPSDEVTPESLGASYREAIELENTLPLLAGRISKSARATA